MGSGKTRRSAQVALSALLASAASAHAYVFTNIADNTGAYQNFFAGPVYNNDGTVAFGASLDTGVAGVFSISGATTTTIADNSGPLSGVVSAGDINTAGTVMFSSFRDAGDAGIFTGN